MEPALPGVVKPALRHCSGESCARARPWMTHTLRLFAVPNGQNSEAPTALAAPEATQMQEIDITSPYTDNAAAGNTKRHTDTENVACDLLQRFEAARTIETTETSAASTAYNVEV